ncbi:MAG: hypothetical protein M1817_001170 [Caeruleum heppii]|nr:MAG: hypothetical protein M1817_001170 [Caeruleum heppii]
MSVFPPPSRRHDQDVIVIDDDETLTGFLNSSNPILSSDVGHLSAETVYEILSDSDEDHEVIILDDDSSDGDIEELSSNVRGSTWTSRRNSSVPIPRRNNVLAQHLRFVRTANIIPNGISVTLSIGQTVELSNGDFLRISSLIQNRFTQVCSHLRGHRFRWVGNMNGMLEERSDEVCMLLSVDADDDRPWNIQGMDEVSVSEVIRLRTLVLTNKVRPALSSRPDLEHGHGMVDGLAFTLCRLLCRWRNVKFFRTARERQRNRTFEEVVERLRQGDSDEGFGTCDQDLRRNWSPETITGGSHHGWRDIPETIDLTEAPFTQSQAGSRQVNGGVETIDLTETRMPTVEDSSLIRGRASDEVVRFDQVPLSQKRGTVQCELDQKYTVGDVFCGAGGASRGATMAGLHVKWGMDRDPAAMTSYLANFGPTTTGTVGFITSVDKFLNSDAKDCQVDILHLSPPCQYFSPAHTVEGKDDEENTATWLATAELLSKTKPRMVTLENTFGLTERHPKWAMKGIELFTCLGYSVRWAVLNCADYGLTQRRRRYILFASCMGEILAPFPRPTHGTAAGLRPFTTMNDAISHIPVGCSQHDLVRAARRIRPSFDGNTRARRVITTGGGGNWHPSGRELTIREFACLQGFPIAHQFAPTGAKKQIGNAVPPTVMKVLFESIKRALQESDGLSETT